MELKLKIVYLLVKYNNIIVYKLVKYFKIHSRVNTRSYNTSFVSIYSFGGTYIPGVLTQTHYSVYKFINITLQGAFSLCFLFLQVSVLSFQNVPSYQITFLHFFVRQCPSLLRLKVSTDRVVDTLDPVQMFGRDSKSK